MLHERAMPERHLPRQRAGRHLHLQRVDGVQRAGTDCRMLTLQPMRGIERQFVFAELDRALMGERGLNGPLSNLAMAVVVLIAMVGIICGVTGTFVILRGLAFMGDALAHAIFPGVVIAFIFGGNFLVDARVGQMKWASLPSRRRDAES